MRRKVEGDDGESTGVIQAPLLTLSLIIDKSGMEDIVVLIRAQRESDIRITPTAYIMSPIPILSGRFQRIHAVCAWKQRGTVTASHSREAQSTSASQAHRGISGCAIGVLSIFQ